VLPAAQWNAQRSRPATHIVGIPGGLCLSSRGAGLIAFSEESAGSPERWLRFAPGQRGRSSTRLRRPYSGGALESSIARRSRWEFSVHISRFTNAPWSCMLRLALQLRCGANGAPRLIALRGQRSVNDAVPFPHGVMSNLARRKLWGFSSSEGRAGHAAGDATRNTITTHL